MLDKRPSAVYDAVWLVRRADETSRMPPGVYGKDPRMVMLELPAQDFDLVQSRESASQSLLPQRELRGRRLRHLEPGVRSLLGPSSL